MLTTSCVSLPVNSHSSVVSVISRFWTLRAAFILSRSALVFKLPSKVGNTNTIINVNSYVISVCIYLLSCIRVVKYLNLVR